MKTYPSFCMLGLLSLEILRKIKRREKKVKPLNVKRLVLV
tara:strand:+ start:401 stop:520 length:120 start_codon:yes stop_codon:yes gene_type:complete